MQLQPADHTAEGLADWLETYLLARGDAAIGAAAGRQLLVNQWATTNETAGMALNSMGRRATILGDQYPFDVTAVGIRRAGQPGTHYTALLALSCNSAPFRQTHGAFDQAAVIFEKLVVAAVQRLLGTGAAAVRFGWPSEEGRPQEFSAAIAWLAGLMGTRLGRAYRPPRRKDGGVDVVGWRHFPDKKPGFPIILVQCTLERDFVHKSRDIDRRIWAGWLAFDADPLAALAIPHVVPREEDWREMAANAVVLDRIRLTSLLRDEATRAVVPEDWVPQQLNGIRQILE